MWVRQPQRVTITSRASRAPFTGAALSPSSHPALAPPTRILFLPHLIYSCIPAGNHRRAQVFCISWSGYRSYHLESSAKVIHLNGTVIHNSEPYTLNSACKINVFREIATNIFHIKPWFPLKERSRCKYESANPVLVSSKCNIEYNCFQIQVITKVLFSQ